MTSFLLLIESAPPEDLDFGMMIFRMLIFLGIVLILIYFVLKKGLPLLVQSPALKSRAVRILERVPVDQKRSLLVVEVQERVYLLGSAEGQINVLIELDRDKMEFQKSPQKNFGDVLKKTFLRTSERDTKA
jgi:flagellar protein FliO/FliZ